MLFIVVLGVMLPKTLPVSDLPLLTSYCLAFTKTAAVDAEDHGVMDELVRRFAIGSFRFL